jgi:hypothetical protein
MRRVILNKKQLKTALIMTNLNIKLQTMEAKYYVAVRPCTNETHSIHKEGCPFLSDDDKRIYLGMFRSGNDALKESRYHFINSSRCPFCSKETETYEVKSLKYTEVNAAQISSGMNIPVTFQNSLFCCVN